MGHWALEARGLWAQPRNPNDNSEHHDDPALIDEMLRTAKTIAVVGMSDKTWRASHNIGRYLAANGYRVIPVNPALRRCWASSAIPTSMPPRPRAREDRRLGSTWSTSSAPPNTFRRLWTM
jgi:hypothetical protein